MSKENRTQNLKKICELYAIVKEAILYSDEIDESKKTNLNITNELRNAFDHLMRVHAAETGVNAKVGKDYIETNIEKCYGHIYRAGYDTFDMLCITLRFEISKIMAQFSNDTIKTVFPEYFKIVRIDLHKLDKAIANVKMEKDVGNPNHRNFTKYAEISMRLRKHYDLVLNKHPVMLEHKEKNEKEEGRKKLFQMIIGIIIAVVAYLLGSSKL